MVSTFIAFDEEQEETIDLIMKLENYKRLIIDPSVIYVMSKLIDLNTSSYEVLNVFYLTSAFPI